MTEEPDKLRVFVDSDVLIAGAASPSTSSASIVILQLSNLTLLNGLISEQVRTEAIRNIQKKVPEAEQKLYELIGAVVNVVDDPLPEVVEQYGDQADIKDTPILAAAIENGCRYLVTFNTRHYFPNEGQIEVVKPGELFFRIRAILAGLE